MEWRALIQALFSRGARPVGHGGEATHGAVALCSDRADGNWLPAGRSCNLVGASGFLGGRQQCACLLGLLLRCGLARGLSVSGIVRHPQSTSAMLWANVHLLVNGDLASSVLFDGVLLWAVVEVMVNNHQEGKSALMKTSQSLGREGLAVAVILGLDGAVAYVHRLLEIPCMAGGARGL